MDLTWLPQDIIILIKEFVLDAMLIRRLPHPPLHHSHIQKLIETASNVPQLLYTLHGSRLEAVTKICEYVAITHHLYWKLYIPSDRDIRLLYASKVATSSIYALCDLNTQKHTLLRIQPRSELIISPNFGVPNNAFLIIIIAQGSINDLKQVYPYLSELQFRFLLAHYQHCSDANLNLESNDDFMKALIDVFTPPSLWRKLCVGSIMAGVMGCGIAATIHRMCKVT